MEDFDYLDALIEDETSTSSSSVYHTIGTWSTKMEKSKSFECATGKRGKKATLTDEERRERVRLRNQRDRGRYAKEKQGMRDTILLLKQNMQTHKDRIATLFEQLSEKAASGDSISPEWVEKVWVENNLSDFMELLLD